MSRLLYSFRDIYCAIKTIDEVCKYSYFSQTSLFAQQKPNVLFGIFTGLIKFQYFCSCIVNKIIRSLIALCLLVMGLCILEHVNYLKSLEICC